jgi:hypothetical protein
MLSVITFIIKHFGLCNIGLSLPIFMWPEYKCTSAANTDIATVPFTTHTSSTASLFSTMTTARGMSFDIDKSVLLLLLFTGYHTRRPITTTIVDILCFPI